MILIFLFPPKEPGTGSSLIQKDFKKEPVVIKEIDTRPTLLRTLGPYDTFTKPLIQSQEHKIHDCSHRRKTDQLNFVVIDTTDHVGGGEREREQLTTFLGNVNSSIEKLFAVCSSPMRKNPPFFLCSKKLGSPASETSTIGTQRSAVTLSKKRKQKKI